MRAKFNQERVKFRVCIEIGIVEGQGIIKLLEARAERILSNMRDKISCTGCESLKPWLRSDRQAITKEKEKEN